MPRNVSGFNDLATLSVEGRDAPCCEGRALETLMRIPATALLALALLAATSAKADEWVAESVHGKVLMFRHGAWVALNSGDIVADDAVIRTSPDGGVRFKRDKRFVDIAGGVQEQIADVSPARAATGAASADAGVSRRSPLHAPYVAAVVKG
jgi:hypothetical protein